jgi:hypothetical protein
MLSCAFCTSCSSQNLTRPKAAELIKGALFSPKATESDQQVALFFVSKAAAIGKGDLDRYRKLEKAGWITLANVNCNAFACVADVAMTDKGTAQSKEWTIQNGVWTIPTARREFGEITGITKPSQSEAGAQYTFRWVPTESGKEIGVESSNPESAEASFQLFDDGWRIVQ